MVTTVSLQCRCGEVTGEAVSGTCTRVVCYCDDCQAFARYLGNADAILDQWGGTDIYQMPQGRVTITSGTDNIRCIRLGPKGIHRWYCNCCRTPIGNTLGPGAPFLGLIHSFFADESRAASAFGPVQGIIFTKFASADAPESIHGTGNAYFLLFKAIGRMLGWKLRGLGKPSVFFDAEGRPVSEPEILST